MKEFFKHLRDILFPDPRANTCRFCGVGTCVRLCGIIGDGHGTCPPEPRKRINAEEQDTPRPKGPSGE